MRTSLLCLVPCTAVAAMLPAVSLADTIVQLQVDVQNPPAEPSMRVPTPGTYTLSFQKNHAKVAFPDGGVMLLDFEKKVVSTLDPKQKSFYQQSFDDYLRLGEKLPAGVSNHFSEKTTVAFTPTVGQESRPIMGSPAAPYNLDLEAMLSRAASQGNGGFHRHRGGGGFPGGGFPAGGGSSGGSQGGGFPGDPSSGAANGPVASTGCIVGGELWMSDLAVGDCDRSQLALTEVCAVMRAEPGLRALDDKLKHITTTLVGADFSVSVLDDEGRQPSGAPAVSMKIQSIIQGSVPGGLFSIPGDYAKAAAPLPPLAAGA